MGSRPRKKWRSRAESNNCEFLSSLEPGAAGHSRLLQHVYKLLTGSPRVIDTIYEGARLGSIPLIRRAASRNDLGWQALAIGERLAAVVLFAASTGVLAASMV